MYCLAGNAALADQATGRQYPRVTILLAVPRNEATFLINGKRHQFRKSPKPFKRGSGTLSALIVTSLPQIAPLFAGNSR